jgi:hypothetical protein
VYSDDLRTYLPPASDTYRALLRTGQILGARICWEYGRRYFFRLSGGDLLSLCPESGERLRVTRMEGVHESRTMWTRVDDLARLSDLVAELSDESVRQGA